jgi:hypothetical protein
MLSDEITGCVGVTVKETPDELPPEVMTVMVAVQGLPKRLPGMVAVSWVELT